MKLLRFLDTLLDRLPDKYVPPFIGLVATGIMALSFAVKEPQARVKDSSSTFYAPSAPPSSQDPVRSGEYYTSPSFYAPASPSSQDPFPSRSVFRVWHPDIWQLMQNALAAHSLEQAGYDVEKLRNAKSLEKALELLEAQRKRD